jgi:hypothetical protein
MLLFHSSHHNLAQKLLPHAFVIKAAASLGNARIAPRNQAIDLKDASLSYQRHIQPKKKKSPHHLLKPISSDCLQSYLGGGGPTHTPSPQYQKMRRKLLFMMNGRPDDKPYLSPTAESTRVRCPYLFE